MNRAAGRRDYRIGAQHSAVGAEICATSAVGRRGRLDSREPSLYNAALFGRSGPEAPR
jgi:hypothetical protein